jgi:hypothetical protein
MSIDMTYLIEYESESFRVDFKKEEYPLGKDGKKNELLKDICAFANQLSDDDKFIVIGVKETGGVSKEIFNIDNPTDEAKYQQFIQDNEPKINFEYKVDKHIDKTMCFFRIFKNKERPYLFKKDVINPQTNKPDYKYGDGFIRIGSSSRKIGRKELDDINKNKLKYFDRRSDLEIVPVIGSPSDGEIKNLDIKYLDIEVINKANKSINFDIEMKLTKKEGFLILAELDFKKQLRKQNLIKKTNLFLPEINFKQPLIGNFNIDTTENESELIVSRTPIKNRTAITLPQNSKQKDVFNQCVILVQNQKNQIKGEVTIRSDDLIDGAFVKKIIFET